MRGCKIVLIICLLVKFRLCPYGAKYIEDWQCAQGDDCEAEELSKGLEPGPSQHGHHGTTSGRAIGAAPRIQRTNERNAQGALCRAGKAIHRLRVFASSVLQAHET